MIRNSILYRRLWHLKRRNARRLQICVRIAAVIVMVAIAASFFEKRLMPSLTTITEYKLRSVISEIVNDSINSVFSGDIKYGDLIYVRKDGSGRVVAIETDVVRLDRLSAEVSAKIRKRLALLEDSSITVPAGTLLGGGLFAGTGPDLRVKVMCLGNVETGFKSELSSAGINQTRYRIILRVKTDAGITAPAIRGKAELVTEVPVAETVIIGEVPYYSEEHAFQ